MSACALFHYALVASERERAAFTTLGILVAIGATASALAIREWGMGGGAVALLVWGVASAGVMGLVIYRSKPKPSIA
jgi:O-antigen/teichoic acid export membrane protein